LEAAGIPCYLEAQEVDPPDARPRPQYELRLLVPSKLTLEAMSVLDKEIFNVEIEAETEPISNCFRMKSCAR
jgi:hypothetical protein